MRRLALPLAVLATLVLSGCRTPTDVTLTPRYATGIDPVKADLAVTAGCTKIEAQGFRCDARTALVVALVHGTPADLGYYGYYNPAIDAVFAVEGHEDVIAHEMQHRQAALLGYGGECFRCQDHGHDSACESGYDLRCRRNSR